MPDVNPLIISDSLTLLDSTGMLRTSPRSVSYCHPESRFLLGIIIITRTVTCITQPAGHVQLLPRCVFSLLGNASTSSSCRPLS